MTTTPAILQGEGLNHETYYRSLPREYYLSPEIFEQEFDKIFARQWLLVGHECQIPTRGDYFTVDLAGENIIITRTDSGDVHAMFNVCRHRGSRVCDAAKGHVTSFVCPYHAWSFGPDGHLEGAPTISDDDFLDPEQYALKPVRTATWRGFIFINLAAEEPFPLRESLAKVEDDLPDLAPTSLKLVHEVVHKVKANWKLVAENNLECYHCPFCHDVLCGAADIDSFKVEIAGAARYAVQDPNFIGGSGLGIQIRHDAKSLTADGNFACKKLLDDGAATGPGFSAGLHVAPIFGAILYYADYIVMQSNFPISVNENHQKVQWFVRADAVEGEDYEVADVIKVLDETAREDVEIIERNGRGAASRAYTPGPLSKTAEPINHLMLSMYLDWMAAPGGGAAV